VRVREAGRKAAGSSGAAESRLKSALSCHAARAMSQGGPRSSCRVMPFSARWGGRCGRRQEFCRCGGQCIGAGTQNRWQRERVATPRSAQPLRYRQGYHRAKWCAVRAVRPGRCVGVCCRAPSRHAW